MKQDCFIGYNPVILLQQNNLKVRNKTRKDLQLLFIIIRM
jgi:hypothetical protein